MAVLAVGRHGSSRAGTSLVAAGATVGQGVSCPVTGRTAQAADRHAFVGCPVLSITGTARGTGRSSRTVEGGAPVPYRSFIGAASGSVTASSFTREVRPTRGQGPMGSACRITSLASFVRAILGEGSGRRRGRTVGQGGNGVCSATRPLAFTAMLGQGRPGCCLA